MAASKEDLVSCGLLPHKIESMLSWQKAMRQGALTLKGAASTVMGPLNYTPSNLTILRKKSSPFLKKPPAVVQWDDFVPRAISFSDLLKRTKKAFYPFEPYHFLPYEECGVVYDLFPNFQLIRQLGGGDNVASINYLADHRDARRMGLKVATQSDNLWILDSSTFYGEARVIAAVVASERKSCPSLIGFDLIEAYNKDMEAGLVGAEQSKTCEHIHRLYGHMEAEQVKYGMICTDGMFWFAEIDHEAQSLRLSEGIPTDQGSPLTAVQAILYVGSLAANWALIQGTSESQDENLLKHRGALFSAISTPLETVGPSDLGDPINIWLGTMIGYGSTGCVHEGWIKRGDKVQGAIIKCANGTYADGSRSYEGAAEARLVNEAAMYERLAHLQGSVIPRLIDQGTLLVECDGRKIPFIAMEMH